MIKNDTLTGGEGNDLLQGGIGDDTYVFAAGHGQDVIEDRDGQGHLQIDDQTIGLATLVVEGVYRIEGLGYSILLGSDGTTLFLVKDGGDGSEVIQINGWSPEKNLGITLSDTPPPTPPLTLVGDFKKATNADGSKYLIVDGNYVADGEQPDALDLLTGAAGKIPHTPTKIGSGTTPRWLMDGQVSRCANDIQRRLGV